MVLNLALSYGGRSEIVRAARILAAACVAKELEPADINDEIFSASLFTANMPDPDLLIRTSGEQRINKQFSLVANGLCGALCQSGLLARLPRVGVNEGAHRLSAEGAPLWQNRGPESPGGLADFFYGKHQTPICTSARYTGRISASYNQWKRSPTINCRNGALAKLQASTSLIILTSVLLHQAKQITIDPVHFAAIMALNSVIGLTYIEPRRTHGK
jgi:hypothetical protein